MELNWFLCCITGKKTTHTRKQMQPTVFLKVKDPMEFKLVFTFLLTPTLLCFLAEKMILFFFSPQSKPPGACPSPATPICWDLPWALVYPGSSFRGVGANPAALTLPCPCPSPLPLLVPALQCINIWGLTNARSAIPKHTTFTFMYTLL